MKRGKRWLFMTATVLLLGVLSSTDAALPFKKVSIAKTPATKSKASSTTTTSTTTTEPETETEQEEQLPPTAEAEEPKAANSSLSKNSKLTGIPQIDYIWDPNLPRELHGYNLSSYPFLSTVPTPDEIHFKCEGLHDGFYASIEYKCQIYHHCVYGIRHDFLCANFTAFDQRTFICHFASDVDCEGSQKYWNRNDELYMATTTSSTSTTTTTTVAPPPTQLRRRAQRPYRRRRPVDDYYYEDELEEDYYEERRRQKPRARPRKPQVQLDYDDEYEDKPALAEEKPPRRNRNRYREEDALSEEDYEDQRQRRRGKPTPRGKLPRQPARVDERRSFNEEEPRRGATGRRRSSDKRTTPSTASVLDELDEYEKPYGLDQEEAAEEQTPQKVKTTPKPLTEYITPKAAAASVYARPRAPPRIARPVPINEKQKYSYPVQKNTATTPSSLEEDPEDDYAAPEQDYEQPAPRRRTAAKSAPTRSTLRKPVTDKKPLLNEDYYEEEASVTPPRRKRPQAQTSSRARAPAADVDFVDEADYEETPAARPAASATRAPIRPRNKAVPARKLAPRPRQPTAAEQDPEPEQPQPQPQQRTRSNALTPARRNQKLALAARQRSKTTAAPPLPLEPEEEQEEEQPEQQQPAAVEPEEEPVAPLKPLRNASVRVVKRPFLPSRGGSPYLPRGLQPVGLAQLKTTPSPPPAPSTESTPIDMGSTISGVRLLEHGAPLLRGDSGTPTTPAPPPPPAPPRSVKLQLDELYENDYDVTLNDALDPTLKPLTPQQPHQHHHQQHQLQLQPLRSYAPAPAAPPGYNPFYQKANIYQHQHQHLNQSPSIASSASQLQSQSPSQSQSLSQSQLSSANNYHSDSYFSSTDIRRRAVAPAQNNARSHRYEYTPRAGEALSQQQQHQQQPQQQAARHAPLGAQHFYDDFTY
ncbi:CG13676 [Drosophila busckii]|uniref:CG13676 n=1 Tax=Drosophila busckii TaxID=30019 RepID=A0A0M4EJV5_DROBS|nr:LOW QUALITY PROTEIN: proteoglycan 4 [Drosophila busckii]ALC43372.1 CG13676 [Drosophila busckii]